MLNIERALKHDRLLWALTGLHRKAFEALLETFSILYEQTRQTQSRQRAVGGGRKARLLNTQEKLFFILFYFKCYPTFDLAGLVFDLHRSQAHEWMHRLQPILESTLGEKMVLPERKLDSIEAFLERFPAVKRVMIDGTERPIQRPQDPEAQQSNDSGKKKRHTRKHLAAVDETKRVLVLSKVREGKLHDKRFHDEDDIAGSVPEDIPQPTQRLAVALPSLRKWLETPPHRLTVTAKCRRQSRSRASRQGQLEVGGESKDLDAGG